MGDTGLEPVTSSVSYWRASQLRQSPVVVAMIRLFRAAAKRGG